MAKIKVVQIAVTSNETDTYAEYLDDKGRVWFQTYKYDSDTRQRELVWMKLDLPEDNDEL